MVRHWGHVVCRDNDAKTTQAFLLEESVGSTVLYIGYLVWVLLHGC